MKLSRVFFENMRGKSFDFVPEKVNTFFAPNGAGKTTVQDGIRYGLTGLCPKDVEGKPHAEFTIDGGSTFVRDRVCKVDGTKVSSAAAFNGVIESEIGVPIESIKVASSSEVLLAKKPEDFLSILMEYIPEELDLDKLKGFFSSIDPETEGILDKYFPAMPETFSIEKLDEVAATLYAERKKINAELSSAKAVLESLAGLPAPSRSLAEIEKDLDDARSAEKDKSLLEAKKRAYDEAVAKAEVNAVRIKDLEAKAAAITVKPISEQQMMAYNKSFEENDKRLLESSMQASTVKKNIELFQNTLDNLDKPICPISRKLVCSTDKSAVKAEITKALNDNSLLLKTLEENVKNARERKASLLEKKKEFDEVNRTLMEKERILQNAKMLADNPVAIPEKPIDLAAGTDVRTLIDLFTRELGEYNDFVRKEKLEKDVNLKTTLSKTYDDLIKSLKDKGEVKTKVIAFYFSLFETVVNNRAKELAPGYEMKFVAAGGVEPLLKTPSNGAFVPMNALSSGERMIGSFLLMDMLNQLNGTRLCFLDNVEILDEDTLRNLRALIETPAFLDAYDHVFIFGVDHDSVVRTFDGFGKKVA